MSQHLEEIDRRTLLSIANEMLAGHDQYFEGMQAADVVQNGDLLMFSGDYFLDEQGLPGPRSTQVFNVFKFLTTELSTRYRLAD